MSDQNILTVFAQHLSKSAMMTGEPSEHTVAQQLPGTTALRVPEQGTLNMMPVNAVASAPPKPGTDTSKGLKGV